MPSPSKHLQQTLAELQLCSAEQLAACEPQVRRLTHNLPDFDSCWLDVLVARRVVTPWQADCLLSPNPQAMQQGRYRLREPQGETTWLAETLDRQRLVVLRRLAGTTLQRTEQIVSRAVQIPESALGFAHDRSSVCVPREYIDHASEPGGWFVSSFVPGWRLDELLIRGGRMPWPVVAEIGRSLLEALRELQRAELVHGDINLRNVRLQPNGHTVLVDPFSAALLRPTVGFRSDLCLRNVQFCAPERIGTGRGHDSVGDVYSTGRVLWELLTARPAFLSADPVTYLMQVKERELEDVRKWVPDCPDWMAHQLTGLTRRSPELRSATAAEALTDWTAHSGRGISRTRRLLNRLPDRRTTSLVVPPTPPRRRALLGAGATAAIVGGALLGLSSGLIPLPMQLNREAVPVSSASTLITPTDEESLAAIPTDQPIALPQPSADGIMTLLSGQRYFANSHETIGTLDIRTTGPAAAVIEVAPKTTWQLSADQVRLRNVVVARANASSDGEPLLSTSCRVLHVDHCVMGHPSTGTAIPLVWQPAAEGSTIVRISNSVLRGGSSAIRTLRSPGRAELENCLIDGARTAWRCDDVSTLKLSAARITQLGGLSFLDAMPAGGQQPVRIEITLGDSVLTPSESLVRLASRHPDWRADRVQVAFRLPNRANPSVVLPSVNPVAWHDSSLNHMVALQDAQIISESLLLATPQFAESSTAGDVWSFARLTDFDGPKLGTQLPGVDTSRLPVPPVTPSQVAQETLDVPRTQR